MDLITKTSDVALYHCDHEALARVVAEGGGCDALIVDAPYSAKTHDAHGEGTAAAGRVSESDERRTRVDNRTGAVYAVGVNRRRRIEFDHWAPCDVERFVAAWAPAVRGWWVSLTDHALAPAWAQALHDAGLYTFAPIACTEPGSRVRIGGDGPAQWSCFAVVARPRAREWQRWGALPGGYVVPPGFGSSGERREVVGGKSLWLMERLVEDYSRPGDLVVDPCCGAGTTLRAAVRTGRRAIGGDAKREHADLAARLLSEPQQRPLLLGGHRG